MEFSQRKPFHPLLDRQRWPGNMNPDFASCGFQLSIKTVVDFPGKMISRVDVARLLSSCFEFRCQCRRIVNALQTNWKSTLLRFAGSVREM